MEESEGKRGGGGRGRDGERIVRRRIVLIS